MICGKTILIRCLLALAAALVWPLAYAQAPAKGPAETVQAHLQGAQQAQREGDAYRAESEYRQALGLSLEQLGSIYSTLGDLDKAESAYSSATHATSDSEISLLGLSVVYLRKSEYEKGIEAVRTILAQNPFDPQARDLLGKLYFAMNRYDAAAQELGEAVRMEPENLSASFTLALAFLKQKKVDPARKVFDQMRTQTGESARLHMFFGAAYRQAEFYDQAIEEFQKAVKADPSYPHVHYFLALAYLSSQPNKEKQKLPEAVQELKAELSRIPDDYLTNYLLGVVYVDDLQFQEAIPFLQKAERQEPNKPEPPLFLGQALFLSGQQDKAIPELRRAIELTRDPSRNDYQISNGHYMLGRALLEQGSVDEAKAHLKLAEEYKAKSTRQEQQRLKTYLASTVSPSENGPDSALDSDSGVMVVTPPAPNAATEEKLRKAAKFFSQVAGNAANQLGLMRASQSDFKHAAAYFSQAADWDPELPDLYFNLGLAQFKAQDYSAAVAPLEKVRAQQPKRSDVQLLLGMSYFFSENYARAKEQIDPLVQAGLDDPQALYALGLSLAYSDEQKRGEQVLMRLVERHPEVADAHLALGQAMALQGQYVPAAARFAKALELDPSLPAAHYYEGLVLLHQAKFSEAADEFQQEIAHHPENAKSHYHLGLCMLSMNRNDDADRSFNEAIRLLPSYADAYYELGKIQLGKGETREAVALLEKAVQLEGNKAYIQYQLSQAYLKAGNMIAAQAALARYRELKSREHMGPRDQGKTSEN